MKKFIVILVIIGGLMISCNSAKSKESNANVQLSGSWELNFISGPRITFEGLYSNRKPTITFDTINNIAGGNTSCNNYSGSYTLKSDTINFSESMAVTRMMCEEMQGETFFLSTLIKIDRWSVTDDGKTLNFKIGDVVMMRFSKIENTIVGNDLSTNGCKSSAGYKWSQVKNKCIRIFEDGVPFYEYDSKSGVIDSTNVAYLIMADNKSKGEIFFNNKKIPVEVIALTVKKEDVLPKLFENSTENINIIYYKDSYLIRSNTTAKYIHLYSNDTGLGKILNHY